MFRGAKKTNFLWLGVRGLTLPEATIAVFLISASVVGTMTLVNQFYSNSRYVDVKSSRDTLFEATYRMISSPGAIFLSATLGGPANDELAKCALGQSGDGACRANVVFDFSMYSPEDGLLASGPMAGPGVFYSAQNGRPCAGAVAFTRECPIELRTSFEAFCAENALTCRQASILKVNYSLTVDTTGTADRPVNLRSLLGSILVDTQHVSLFKEQVVTHVDANKNLGCKPTEMAMGFDGNGNVFCQPLNYLCAPGQAAMGIDRYGRPVAKISGSKGVGEFDAVAEVRCVPIDCAGSAIIGLNEQTATTISNNCMLNAIACDPVQSQVLVDVIAPGTAQCLNLKTCSQANINGSDYSRMNFTDKFLVYNGNVSDGGVVSNCQAFGCGLNIYMGSWDPNGNCQPVAAPGALAVDGVCGPASGTNRLVAPLVAELCSAGNPSAVAGVGPWTWTCQGQNGGANSAPCMATMIQNGQCGTANGVTTGVRPTAPPTSVLCAVGTPNPLPPAPVSGLGPWSWQCMGLAGGTTANCSAPLDITPTQGQCNDALKTAPCAQNPPLAATRCLAGNEVNFTGPAGTPSKWSWTCQGQNGGMDDSSCFALECPGPINGACGTANNLSFAVEPMVNLCDPATPTMLGKAANVPPALPGWNWTCDGMNGGVASPICMAFETPAPIPGECGTANGFPTATAPAVNLCNPGKFDPTKPPVVVGAGPWTWTCTGQNGGADVACSAPLGPACGSANATTVVAPPAAADLCTSGVASVVPQSPPYDWTCTVGPSEVNCSAKTDGVCNAATMAGVYPPAKVFTDAEKCTVGTATPQSAGPPWTWSCLGFNSGLDAPCSNGAAPCPAGNLSWTVGGNTCSGAMPSTAVGSQSSATDSTGPTTGSATFTCPAGGAWAAPDAGSTCELPPAAAVDCQVIFWGPAMSLEDMFIPPGQSRVFNPAVNVVISTGPDIIISGNTYTCPGIVTCGASNQQAFAAAPAAGLCSDGSTPPVTGSGPYTWNCGTVSCSAYSFLDCTESFSAYCMIGGGCVTPAWNNFKAWALAQEAKAGLSNCLGTLGSTYSAAISGGKNFGDNTYSDSVACGPMTVNMGITTTGNEEPPPGSFTLVIGASISGLNCP